MSHNPVAERLRHEAAAMVPMPRPDLVRSILAKVTHQPRLPQPRSHTRWWQAGAAVAALLAVALTLLVQRAPAPAAHALPAIDFSAAWGLAPGNPLETEMAHLGADVVGVTQFLRERLPAIPNPVPPPAPF